jgi:small subunit ribosomal protein S2
MKSYIFTERNGVHIVDLQQTLAALNSVSALVREAVAEGGTVLFVGTKRQAQETIEVEAQRCEMPYVNQRWLGGTLTNWSTIRGRIDYVLNLEARRARGEFEVLTKKEALDLERQITKLNNRVGGIKQMEKLPDLVFVIDIRREATAVKEANKLDIPIVAVVDTNCDPDPIDYVVPANDDAIRAIKLITSLIADAVLEGLALRKAQEPEQLDAEMLVEEDEKYLSAATLARLKDLSFEGEEGDQEGGADEGADAEVSEQESEPDAAEAEEPQAEEAEEQSEAEEAEEQPEAEEAEEQPEAGTE